MVGRERHTTFEIRRPDGSVERTITHVALMPSWVDE
jgi:hypothetical protein